MSSNYKYQGKPLDEVADTLPDLYDNINSIVAGNFRKYCLLNLSKFKNIGSSPYIKWTDSFCSGVMCNEKLELGYEISDTPVTFTTKGSTNLNNICIDPTDENTDFFYDITLLDIENGGDFYILSYNEEDNSISRRRYNTNSGKIDIDDKYTNRPHVVNIILQGAGGAGGIGISTHYSSGHYHGPTGGDSGSFIHMVVNLKNIKYLVLYISHDTRARNESGCAVAYCFEKDGNYNGIICSRGLTYSYNESKGIFDGYYANINPMHVSNKYNVNASFSDLYQIVTNSIPKSSNNSFHELNSYTSTGLQYMYKDSIYHMLTSMPGLKGLKGQPAASGGSANTSGCTVHAGQNGADDEGIYPAAVIIPDLLQYKFSYNNNKIIPDINVILKNRYKNTKQGVYYGTTNYDKVYNGGNGAPSLFGVGGIPVNGGTAARYATLPATGSGGFGLSYVNNESIIVTPTNSVGNNAAINEIELYNFCRGGSARIVVS